MHINLRCSNCDEVSPISYNTLYDIWKAKYNQMPENLKVKAFMTAQIKCLCGHESHFNTPMFKYMFGVIFEELNSLLEDN